MTAQVNIQPIPLLIIGLLAATGSFTTIAESSALPPEIRCVDQSIETPGDGHCWTQAYADLQLALEEARNSPNTITEIWIAEGTYLPTDTGDQSISFEMVDGVSLYGGFPKGGGSGLFSDRDPAKYITILSGDLNGDDQPDFINRSDNIHHVVKSMDIAENIDRYRRLKPMLDGLTIRSGGTGEEDSNVNAGGGIWIDATIDYGTMRGPLINNCIITDCWKSSEGGGLYSVKYRANIHNCTFRNNKAASGGAISANHILMRHSSLFDNHSVIKGGALNTNGDTVELIDCRFIDSATK